MGKFASMPLEVHLEIAFGCKSTATDVALEGTLTCMGANMNLEGRVGAKDFTTVSTTVLEEGLIAIAL